MQNKRETHDSVGKAGLVDLDRLGLTLEAHDHLVRCAEVNPVDFSIRAIDDDLLPPLRDLLLARDLVVVGEVLEAGNRDVGRRDAFRQAEVGVESGLEGQGGDGGGRVLDIQSKEERVRAELDGVGQGEGQLEDRLDRLCWRELCVTVL